MGYEARCVTQGESSTMVVKSAWHRDRIHGFMAWGRGFGCRMQGFEIHDSSNICLCFCGMRSQIRALGLHVSDFRVRYQEFRF
jgi:hypothetical protein